MKKWRTRSIIVLWLFILTLFTLTPPLHADAEVKVQMYNGNTATTINTIFPWFKITNTGSAVIKLADLKIRYYYTIDGEKPQNFWCDWSTIGSSNVTGTFVKLDTPYNGADYYFELGFKSSAGSLAPGQSIEAQNRFAKSDWSNFNQRNDYSFNPTAKFYVDWDKISVHLNDTSTPPITSHDYVYDGQWVTKPIAIHLTASGGSGSLITYYTLNNGTAQTGNIIRITENGIYTVSFWSVDQVGNVEIAHAVTVKLDQTIPTVTAKLTPAANSYGWNNATVTVSFEATDNPSGVATVSDSITVNTEGSGQQLTGTATDNAGNIASVTAIVNLDTTAPVISNLTPNNGTIINNTQPTINAVLSDALSGIDTAAIKLYLDSVAVTGLTMTSDSISYTPSSSLANGSHTVMLKIYDNAGNYASKSTTFTVDATLPDLPPDPAEVAPPLDNTQVTDLCSATKFLYTGNNPIQTGVDPETIEPQRAAVLRGRVLSIDGKPLPGVRITVLEHPEFGQTLSRLDGVFDLAVNGGGLMTVKYERSGFLGSQRQINVPWQDYTWLPEVVLIEKDTQVTPVTLNSNETQVARSSVVSDKDGTRQATIIFPQGTKVDGYSGDTLHIRATEYTVGENGPKAMPAELPQTTGYTYCVELSADETENIIFSQSVYFYLENYLNFPVGDPVPTGYYDKTKGIWVASQNGQIIRILGINNGRAELDIDGSGDVADESLLATLNITSGELQEIASQYPVGQSLWRVPINHFTPWDCNWPYGPPKGIKAPKMKSPGRDKQTNNPRKGKGCIIEVDNQAVGETVNISGTLYTLNYNSALVSGRTAAYSLDIPLTDNELPPGLKRIELIINVAGKNYTHSFSPSPNQSYLFVWDGLDSYGRVIRGQQYAYISLGYTFDLVYQQPQDFAQSFDDISGIPYTSGWVEREITLWDSMSVLIGNDVSWDIQEQRLGGWSLNVHHSYDPRGKVLYLGSGERRNPEGINSQFTIIAGKGRLSTLTGITTESVKNDNEEDGGDALQASLNDLHGISVGPDGCIYITSDSKIRKIDKQGIISTIAGTGEEGFDGDGGPAIEAQLNNPNALKFDRWGNLFVLDSYNNRIRRINTQGTIDTVYDGGGDSRVSSFTLGNDGSIYISDNWNNKVIRIHPDGRIEDYAGTGEWGFSGDDEPAYRARLSPFGIDVDKEGYLYIADTYNECIRKVSPFGIIETVAGVPNSWGEKLDGIPATEAYLGGPTGVSIGLDGCLYINDYWNGYLRKVGHDGIITSVAYIRDYQEQYCGYYDTMASMFTVGPDGIIYLIDTWNGQVLKFAPMFPGFDGQDIVIPSEDGSEIYQFNGNGKHLSTIDTLTGLTKFSFRYNSNGLLSQIIDSNGNCTTIERDSSGNPTAIISPYGQRTNLNVDSKGYIDRVTNPANESVKMTYYQGGLLESFTDPMNGIHHFYYDDAGRFIKNTDPVGGFTELSRTEIPNGFRIVKTVAAERSKEYKTIYTYEDLPNGETKQTVTDCYGQRTEVLFGVEGYTKTNYPDGTSIEIIKKPDPRFGMTAPINQSIIIKTPDGLINELKTEREVILNNPRQPLSVQQLVERVESNGRVFTNIYDASTKTITNITPAERIVVSTLDTQGRIVEVKTPGTVPINIGYDERGRIQTYTEVGESEIRVSKINYNEQGLIESTVNALSEEVRFEYDTAGRMLKQIFPDGRYISFSYDSYGQIVSITPPGQQAHHFTYTSVSLTDTYTPPEMNGGEVPTQYEYNLARQITGFTNPDGTITSYRYDNKGRLLEIVLPVGRYIYTYDTATGNLKNITAPDNGLLTYFYDGSLIKNVSWSGGINGSVSCRYDNDFQIIEQSVNGGNTITFQYNDPDGLLTQAGALKLNRDVETGRLTGTSIKSLNDTIGYNEFGEINSYTVTFNRNSIYNVDYKSDKLGRISEKTEILNGQTDNYCYIYDRRGQLTDVYKNGSISSHYEYDPNGNRLAYSGINGNFSGMYDGQDRMTQYGNNNYQYNANGELRVKTNNAGDINYVYDALGNLVAVTFPNGTRIDYILDGQGRRIGKKVNGVLTQGLLYENAIKPVAELDGNGNLVARFVYATSNVPDYIIKNGVTYRIISDHLGSPRLVVNVNTGQVIQEMEYDEYGNVIKDTNPGFQPFGFAGGIYDNDTKLVQFGFREYDAESGRWISKDPINFEGGDTNLYRYVANDPVNDLDPTGLSVGQPGFAESLIPIWGEGRAAVDDWQNGKKGWALLHGGLAVSDVFAVKALVTAAGKGVIKAGLKGGTKVAGRELAEEGVEKGAQGLAKGACFTEDTLILTKDGSKSIKNIKVGDEVYSENPDTGEKGFKRVTNAFIKETDTLIHIFVSETEIKTTITHPFWVIGRGWVNAGELKAGDKVLLSSGAQKEITDVQIEKLKGIIKVYNFEVEDWHTYFVSDNNILVHNMCAERYRGNRWTSGDDALEQLEGIEKAQQNYYKGKSKTKIDSIGKSEQRAKQQLKRIDKQAEADEWSQ